MAAKRKTKAQRQLDRVEAIRLRLVDILCGAYGPYNQGEINEVIDGDYTPSMLGVRAFKNFIGGVRNAWGVSEYREDHPWNVAALDNWDKPLREIAEWLDGFNVTDEAMKGRL